MYCPPQSWLISYTYAQQFEEQKSQNFLGRGHIPFQDLISGGEGTTLSTSYALVAYAATLALALAPIGKKSHGRPCT